MYIRSVKIQNIKSIKDLSIDFSQGPYPGWHVVIGDNGSGKTTVAKSIALGLIGGSQGMGLRENWHNWLRLNTRSGKVLLTILKEGTPRGYSCGVGFKKANSTVKLSRVREFDAQQVFDPDESLSEEMPIIFSASYGPFRRFTGGSKNPEKIASSYPRLVPHLSLFGEDFAFV